MRYLSIKNHKAHQHYKNRRPPWIKLHVAILDDYAFSCLQDASKAHLLLLGVLASKMDNRIPLDRDFLARKLGTTDPVDVEVLIAHGFIEVTEDDASKPLARRKQVPIVETETETETEKSLPSQKAATVTWITPYCLAWKERFGGDLPVKHALVPLGKLRKEQGDPEVLRRWAVYLAATEGQYASPARFGSTWNEWSGAPTEQPIKTGRPARVLAATEML